MGLTAPTQFKQPRVALRREVFFTLIIFEYYQWSNVLRFGAK
jgi:hypothetical protein